MSARILHPLSPALPAALLASTLISASTFISGCTVGPNFAPPETKSPETSPSARWSSLDGNASTPSTPGTPGNPSKATAGAAEIARWWTSFNDPTLTSLVERAIAGNLDMAAAEARIRAARARRAIAGGAELPQVNANGFAGRQPDFKSTSSPFMDNDSLFAAGFDATWELDIFGRTRRIVEATDADVAVAEFDLRDVQVTLAGEVASNYLRLRAAQAQLAIARGDIAAEDAALEVIQKLHDSGLAGALDLANARALAESTRARLPVYESEAKDATLALGVLLGGDPSSLAAELTPPAPIPALPAQIPVGIPSELLQRRPDIRRAEAELHAATARIGVAVADQFPRFSLSAAIGTRNSDAGEFASFATNYWAAGAGATMPIFDGGRIKANIELQKSLTDAALAQYRQRVLVALREVEVALTDFANEQQRHASLARAVDAGKDAVSLASSLYASGRTDFLNVVTAERVLLVNQESLTRSERQIAEHLVSIYKALGGGWNDTASPTAQAN